MSIILNRELEQIEADIKQSILDSDQFAYSKHLRRKQETTDKLFFSETASLREQIENLESDRSLAVSLRDDLTDESKAAADEVLRRRSDLFDAEQIYQKAQSRLFYLDTTIEQQRTDIKDLKRKLDLAVDKKLNPDNYDESGNLKRTVTTND